MFKFSILISYFLILVSQEALPKTKDHVADLFKVSNFKSKKSKVLNDQFNKTLKAIALEATKICQRKKSSNSYQIIAYQALVDTHKDLSRCLVKEAYHKLNVVSDEEFYFDCSLLQRSTLELQQKISKPQRVCHKIYQRRFSANTNAFKQQLIKITYTR